MRHTGGGQRRLATLLLSFVLVTSTAAEEGMLVLRVVDVDGNAVAEVRIGTEGTGGSPQFTDQNGQARLRLPNGTKPAALVTLQIANPWRGAVLKFVSPFNRQVRVPPYEDAPENFDEVLVAKKHDVAVLEEGAGLAAVHAMADKSAPAKPKPQGRNREPFGAPQFQTVVWRIVPAAENPQPTGIDEAADYFGLPPAKIVKAIANWGGTPLLWKMVRVTGAVDAGGSNPFTYVRATKDDIFFGIAPWSLHACTLQPLLLRFQQRDSKRFARIVGADTDWLTQTLNAPCQESSKAVAEHMLAAGGGLSPEWRKRLRQLGRERSFQHVAVNYMAEELQRSQSQASSLGFSSEQAIAFVYASGDGALREQQSLATAVGAFKQQLGRAPDEQEALLILANQMKPRSDRTELFAQGSASAFGATYGLEEFAIGFRDPESGEELPLHNYPKILSRLKDGWIPAQPVAAPAPVSTKKPPPTDFGGAPCDATTESQLIDLINRERVQQGVPAVQANAQLADAARAHTAQVVRHQELSHQFPGEPALGQRYVDVKLVSTLDGENVDKGKDVAAAHSHFMHSPHHRATLLDPKFNAVGVGALCSGGTLYVTQDFAHLVQTLSNEEAAGVMQQALAKYAAQKGITLPAATPSPALQQIVCDLAHNGTVDPRAFQQVPGARGVMNWSTPDPSRLIKGAADAVTQPLTGYSLAACSVPNPTGPGVLYSIVMVTY